MPNDGTIPMQSVSLAGAQRVVTAAIAHATSIGCAACVVVVDPSGEPVATVRMDGAPRLSAGIAANKAYTVTGFGGMPTAMWWGAIESDPSLVHGITHTPRLIVFGGGVPLMADGALVGAVGVSGGTTDQDVEIATAGAAAL
jgi:glc operon protein GlcG